VKDGVFLLKPCNLSLLYPLLKERIQGQILLLEVKESLEKLARIVAYVEET
jgi:hypothetical protein